MIFTSRFFNPELTAHHDLYSVVRISVGFPRFLPYKLAGSIKELAPKGLLGMSDKFLFRQLYFDKLDFLGVDHISYLLQNFEKLGKHVVLCCFEDIRKGGDNWCHRTMFADWWFQNTNQFIDELDDPSVVKLELSDSPFSDILKDTFGKDYFQAV